MRVLFLSDVYFPRINGVSTSIATFRADLEACGVETQLVAPDYPRAQGAPAEEGILRVPSAGVPGDPEDRRMRWKPLRRALDSLAGEHFDLVHVHTPFVAHYAGVRHARERRIPCIATCHTHFEEYLHHYWPLLPRPLARALARAFTRSQCRRLDALIAPSAAMRDVLERYRVAAPVRVVPTGLRPDRFVPGDGARFRARFGIAAEQPLLLHAGRVAHEKNIDFLVRCFARVRIAEPAAVLLIAGEGPAERSLRQLASELGLADGLRFVGYLDHDRTLLDAYAAADVFIFASRTETQGLVLLEAMAQGTPIVSTAVLGTRSILGADSGAIVVPERADDFAAAVVRVLRAPGLRHEIAARCRAHAESWSALTMARRLAAIYADVCMECGEEEEGAEVRWDSSSSLVSTIAHASPHGDGEANATLLGARSAASRFARR